MQLTEFYQQAVKTIKDVIHSVEPRLASAGLRCHVVSGEGAHIREGHPEISVEIWSGRNLVDVIEFTPDISYPDGGDTSELKVWFDHELNRSIASYRP